MVTARDDENTGLQLWINLPRNEKQIDPSYQEVKQEQLPVATSDGVAIRTLVGKGSPVIMQRPLLYQDITMSPGSTHSLHVPEGYQGFLYVIAGQGTFAENQTHGGEGEILVLDISDLEEVLRVDTSEGIRFVWLAGLPIGEQPQWRGSYVD